ncbi:hypothetical protein [Nocardioides sp. 616]|uniref:hypothetical protein n=1 Tax=Nocardioides sp. 616 TaxID=2268090 RepID=UPI0013B40931|nr:hypothetical protein [Nocardioides sp. 616]
MKAKKLILVLVVVFLGFWMFTDPSGLAEAAKSGAGQAWELTTELFRALINFFGALT